MKDFSLFNFIKNQFNWLKGSGDNDPGGASSKKLTGFVLIALTVAISSIWAIWSYKHNDWSMLPIVLPTLLGAALGALGIASNEKIKLKQNNLDENGGDNTK